MYKPTIGLEIHIELNTRSKMFCQCLNNSREEKPNINVCPICMGHPGTLPVINEEAVRKVVKTGLALNCEIPKKSKFDRKNYFYPDLPKGYQISQYDLPLCKGGFLIVDDLASPAPLRGAGRGASRKIKITRVHLEEDTGKLIHPKGARYSLIDFNRAGVPLMELVTEPDIKSGREARRFSEELQTILRYLDVSDADMEKGQMRVEVNISLSKDEKLGTKVEVKNLNSFRVVEKSIDYEIKRQEKVLRVGKKIVQETRGWDDKKSVTVSQREKEEAHDYRYFPEPDLPLMKVGTSEYLDEIKSQITELPQLRRKRFKEEYNLSDKEIDIFILNKDLGEYYEKMASELKSWLNSLPQKPSSADKDKIVKIAANYLLTDVLGLLKGVSISSEKFLITPENFAEFITLIYRGEISSKIAKAVLLEMFKTGADPSQIIEKKGLAQISDESEIEKIIKQVISENEKATEDYQKGKEIALQFLVGQVMAKTKGKAKPDIIIKILKKKLT